MLNKNNERELAYVVTVDAVTPIEGYDRVELAHVGGWTIVVGKGEFRTGDPAIYFEIDSKLPEVEPFINMEFLAKKKYKIKTQKMCKSISQGLLMSAANFGWKAHRNARIFRDEEVFDDKEIPGMTDTNGKIHYVDDESRFLTKQLGVTYYVAEDNARKAASADKYKKMAQRNGKLFSHQPFRWLMKYTWGKKLLFVFFGRKRDKKTAWPNWVSKTDEERIENLPYLFKDKSEWIATEKIDGTSTTFTLKRGHRFKKDEFYVCSRNVVFDKPDKECFYDTNVYTEMAKKYHIYDKMKRFLNMNDAFADCDWITIQGETYGEGIQKRDYHMNEHNFMAFNFITSKDGRWNSVKMKDFLEKENGIPCVPILDEQYVLPDTLDELREYVDSKPSIVDGDLREGIVFRSQDGTRSFKCVSPTFLLKFHQ
jgi:hypothetical protein